MTKTFESYSSYDLLSGLGARIQLREHWCFLGQMEVFQNEIK